MNIYSNIFNKKKIIILAEPSGNHGGNIKKLFRILTKIKSAGADAAKIQLYNPESITIKSNRKDFLIDKKNTWAKYKTLYDLYDIAATPINWAEDIFKFANKINLPIISSVFDFEGLEKLESLKCPAYKIASNEITDLPLIKSVLSKNKPTLISTGMATLEDINLINKNVNSKFQKKIIWMKCTSSYPTPYEEVNLNHFHILKKKGGRVGLSDHTKGIHIPIAATALGYSVIEKHIKLDDETNTVDSFFSLNPQQFKLMIKLIREVELSLENKNKFTITKSSKLNYRGRRSLYIVENISKGDRFTNKNIRSIRPGFGLHPIYLTKILNKKSTKNLKKGMRMKHEYVSKF